MTFKSHCCKFIESRPPPILHVNLFVCVVCKFKQHLFKLGLVAAFLSFFKQKHRIISSLLYTNEKSFIDKSFFSMERIKKTYMNQSYRVVLHVSSFFDLLFFRWYHHHSHHHDDKYNVAISFQK